MPGDRLNRFEESYVPTVARPDLPLSSVVNLRRVAAELRGLADRLDWLSRDNAPAAEVLFSAWTAARHTGRNCAKIRRPGRPLSVGRRKPTRDIRGQLIADADHKM